MPMRSISCATKRVQKPAIGPDRVVVDCIR